ENLTGRTNVDVALLVECEVLPTEGPFLALRLVDHRDVRGYLRFVDQPVEVGSRNVGRIASKPLGLDVKAWRALISAVAWASCLRNSEASLLGASGVPTGSARAVELALVAAARRGASGWRLFGNMGQCLRIVAGASQRSLSCGGRAVHQAITRS